MLISHSSFSRSTPSYVEHLTATLRARLERYQKELTDCENTNTGSTHQGRERIQAIVNKINDTRARLETQATSRQIHTEMPPATAKSYPEVAAKRTGAGLDVFA